MDIDNDIPAFVCKMMELKDKKHVRQFMRMSEKLLKFLNNFDSTKIQIKSPFLLTNLDDNKVFITFKKLSDNKAELYCVVLPSKYEDIFRFRKCKKFLEQTFCACSMQHKLNDAMQKENFINKSIHMTGMNKETSEKFVYMHVA